MRIALCIKFARPKELTAKLEAKETLEEVREAYAQVYVPHAASPSEAGSEYRV
jgi:hypothetical protein